MAARARAGRGVALLVALFIAAGLLAGAACALSKSGLEAVSLGADGAADDGDPGPCGANVQTDPANCGACGHACPAGPHQLASCVAASCGVTCAAGYTDCDGQPQDGCEVATGTDPANCGACARTCQGGACAGGLCQPTTLATNQQRPVGIAVDDQFVFWSVAGASDNSGEVMRAKLDGSSATVLAAGLASPGLIALDATTVFWTNQGTAARGQTDGSAARIGKDGTCGDASACPFVMASNIAGAFGIAATADGSHVVVTEQPIYINWIQTSAQYTLPLSTLGNGPVDVVFDGDGGGAYVTTVGMGARGGAVSHVGIANAPDVTPLAGDASSPTGIVLDDAAANAFVAITGDGLLWDLPLDGGPASTVASDIDHPAFVVLDGDTLYFTAEGSSGMSDGYVGKIGKDGVCPATWGAACPAILASGQGFPSALAVDATYVYWVDAEGGTVLKVLK